MNEKPSWDQAPPRAKFLALTDAGWGFFEEAPEDWWRLELRSGDVIWLDEETPLDDVIARLTRSTAIEKPLAGTIRTALEAS